MGTADLLPSQLVSLWVCALYLPAKSKDKAANWAFGTQSVSWFLKVDFDDERRPYLKIPTYILAWPHFWRTQLHSPPNGDFAQEFEPASYFCDWTCVHLGMRRQKSPKFDFQSQFSMSKISFIILIFVSVKIIRLGVQLMIYQFLITSFFEVVYFLKLGPIFVASWSSERKSNRKNN